VKSLATLELGVLELKAAQADGRQLTHHAEVMLPPGLIQDGVPGADFGIFLRQVLQGAGITARRLRVAITDGGTAVRDFRLPILPVKELAAAVLFEGKRLIPIDPQTVYYAWHARRLAGGHAVYLVAARREMVDGLVAGASAAGLEVDRIDLKVPALARGMGAADGLICDWAAAEATVALMVEARPRFFRTFAFETEDQPGQLDELISALDALVKFMRSSEGGLVIGPNTPLYLAGRFGTEPAAAWAERFPFDVRMPAPPVGWVPSFPWPVHLTALGLIGDWAWQGRLTPEQGGDNRVAA
jgi:hypothetical protein